MRAIDNRPYGQVRLRRRGGYEPPARCARRYGRLIIAPTVRCVCVVGAVMNRPHGAQEDAGGSLSAVLRHSIPDEIL